jgi:tetratricopeptide (TPR) repeat protein
MRPFALTILVVLLAVPGAGAQGQPPDATPGYYFMLGRHLESTGKIDEAIAAHQRAIALAPESAELRAELAGLYARQDRAREALDTAEEALRLDPDNREANRILGSVYAALSEQKKAFRPGDDPTQYASKALAALTKARRDGGFDVSLELMLGRLQLQAGNMSAAIASLRRVVDDQPGYPEAAMMLAAAQSRVHDDAGAITTLEVAVGMNPTFLRGQMRLAELYEEAHRYKDAAAVYEAAQASLGTRADLTAQRASALLNAGDPASARDLLQKTLAAKPNGADSSLLYLLGQAQRQLKDRTGAAATAQKLTTAFPGDPRALYLRAQLLVDGGQSKEALAAFEELVKVAPENGSVIYEYADLLEKNGRPKDAERVLRDLLQRDPLDANALNSLGYMLAERGERLDEAVGLVQRALKVEPGNPSYLDSLGWAYFRQGKLDLAEPPLAEAASKSPTSSAIQDHLGDLRMKQQRYADAASAWERALAGDGQAIDRPAVEKKLREARAR